LCLRPHWHGKPGYILDCSGRASNLQLFILILNKIGKAYDGQERKGDEDRGAGYD
jgi:hypothetical protein